jgi:cobalt-zinc-cadmium resistance protein CzcA
MLQRLVVGALRLPFIVLVATVAAIALGLGAWQRLDIEAYPNPVPPLVETLVQPPGWSADEVERYVTIPLETGLAGMPGLESLRSISLFGLSDVKCYFRWGTEYKDARQETINRLQFVQLPNGLTAQLSPWNAIGEVFRYVVRGKDYDLMDMKTAEDWTLERQWRQVDGVIDVTSYGGLTKQFQVQLDPFKLRGQNVGLPQVIAAIGNANQNVGGQRMFMGEQSYDVRGVGLVQDTHDIERVVVQETRGVPIRVGDLGKVVVGPAPRLGMVGYNDDPDVVQGIVLMRYGGETPHTLAGVHARVDFIKEFDVLPPGMSIEPYYDRGKLVELTTHTVVHNMIEGMVLVTLVLFLFLGHVRAALITALNIPIALLIAFMGMVATGTPANLISLGAVDFGIVVDSTVIMMENLFRHLGHPANGQTTRDRLAEAAREVGGPMLFSTAIIAVAFLPLFTLTGVSGVIFSPMAHTYAFAIGGAIILALTLTPVLAARVMPPHVEEKENALMRVLHRLYDPLFDAAIRKPKQAVFLRLIPILLCVVLFPFLGREFMPKLEEGNFWIRATLPMSVSLDQSSKYVDRMRRIVRGCPEDASVECTDQNRTRPEVLSVVSQLGRPDDGTDVTGFYNIELFAPLKPFEEFRKGVTKEQLTEQLQAELAKAFPGVVFNFSQYISDNVEEALAGVKGQNAVKVIGNDLRTNEETAKKIVEVMSTVRGVADLGLIPTLGEPNVKITPDRKACARYGLNSGDVTNVVAAAIGGAAVTQVLEGDRQFDLTVRWLPQYRRTVEQIREIPISTPDGIVVPLGQVAKVVEETGPAMIYREGMRRYAPVKFSVRGRDLKGTIDEAQARIAKEVKLPYGTRLVWAGEINELNDAEARLRIIIPVTLLLITVLVYSAVKNWLDTLIILIDIPVATTGGILALLLTKTHFSVSAAMGFVSVFGIAVQDALLMVSYFQKLHFEEGLSVEQAAREASEKRFRPVLMTALVATLGLLPAALSNGIGAQTQKPLAIVVIGGSIELAVLTRLLQPPLRVLAYNWLESRRKKKGKSDPPPPPAAPPPSGNDDEAPGLAHGATA